MELVFLLLFFNNFNVLILKVKKYILIYFKKKTFKNIIHYNIKYS